MSGFSPNFTSNENFAIIQYGGNEETREEFIGLTIAQFRALRGEQWSLPDAAKATQAGRELPENYVIRRGDRIEFARRQGEKG